MNTDYSSAVGDPQRVEMRCGLTIGLVRDLVEATKHMPDAAPVDVQMSGSVPVSIAAGVLRR